MFKTLLFAIGAFAKFYESRAISQNLRDINHCETKELAIQEQINEITRNKKYDRNNPHHRRHLDALHRWLQQWQERKAACDERLQRE
jgi:hypothetical protein